MESDAQPAVDRYICPNCEKEFAEAWTSQNRVLCSHCSHSFTVRELRKAAALRMLPPGTVLGGFEVLDVIGSGGMSHVFRARQVSLDREVALKVMKMATDDEATLQQFVREMRVTAKLSHLNIVTLFEAGYEGDMVYYAMDLIKGESLDRRMKRRRGPLEELEALHIVRQVAVALQYAWEKHGIAHRDVKPGNVIVDRQNRVKLLDLGIAKRTEDVDHESIRGLAIGTPYYMSPEQARGRQDMDFRSDVYSLGATLYHLLTGRVPFFADEIAAILRQHISSPCPQIRFFSDSVSKGCDDMVHEMMAKKRSDRHASWQEVIDHIDVVMGVKEGAPRVKPEPGEGSAGMESGPPISLGGLPANTMDTISLTEAQQKEFAAGMQRMQEEAKGRKVYQSTWFLALVALVLVVVCIVLAVVLVLVSGGTGS